MWQGIEFFKEGGQNNVLLFSSNKLNYGGSFSYSLVPTVILVSCKTVS